MELKATRYQVDADGVALVTLNRPDRNNAWTGRMHAEYRWCLAEADRDPAVRVVVVTGAGRAFCVGADSSALEGHVARGGYDAGLPPEPARPGYGVRPEWDHDFVWHFGLRLPVVGAVNGACAGVGLVLACYCDVRFVAAEAKLTTAHGRLGLPPEYGLSWLLPRLVGVTRAADLLLSSRVFTGTEAAELGLANAALAADDVLPHALAYARRLATEVSPASIAASKRMLYADLLHHDVGASVEEAGARLNQMMGGPDFAEGVAALQARRPPRF